MRWSRWFALVTAGEFLGFVAPAAVGALSTSWPMAATAPALLAAGAVEGSALGWAQARAFALPGLPVARFVLATAAGAVAAYAPALVPMAREGRVPLPLLVVGGLVLLLTIGTAQWLVLRSVVPHCGWWVATTAGAWMAGLLAFTAVAPPLWQPGQPLWLRVAIGVLGGLVMAAVVAALTGLAAVRVSRRAAPRPVRG
ncbi:hypothetical protein [Pseudonocardia xishanensis]|uniref:Uncharacterized protein n=1 Tax=Pseudonocardia xishanensis TaxID=630995 RepID=A0ABP8RLM3_9PSEU